MLKKTILLLIFLFGNCTFMQNDINLKYKIPKKQNIVLLNYNIDDLLTPEIKEKTSKFIVKSLSDTLPQFDYISHIVLNTNSKLITSVLQDEFLPSEIKKKYNFIYY